MSRATNVLDNSSVFFMGRAWSTYSKVFTENTKFGISEPNQFKLLALIEEHPDSKQTHLCDISGIDRSTLSEMLRTLQSRSLITRERDPADQRVVRVVITATGRQAITSAVQAANKAERALTRAFSPHEFATLRAIKAKLIAAEAEAYG